MTYYWVLPFSTTKDGRLKPWIIKGKFFNSEQAAQTYASELGMNARVFPVHSRNKKIALQEVKLQLVEEHGKEGEDWVLGTTRASWKEDGGVGKGTPKKETANKKGSTGADEVVARVERTVQRRGVPV